MEKGKTEFSIPTTAIEADPPTGGLENELAALQKQLSVNIQLEHAGQKTQPSPADIGAWFVQSGQTMVLSADKVRAYVQTLESSLFNGGDAVSAVSYALNTGQDITFVLESTQTPVKYTYCASVRGAGEEHLAGFAAKVAAVLGDPRGWNAGGRIGFERVENGCDFSLWLSAPSQMTSFGGLCDPFWSCRSGRNVVINFDRWQGATDAWNTAGGGLEDYRVMVTNHEVGHWLGFGHRNCPGPGQPAPVMMQQSIDLKGCAFNPWPVADELNTLKQNKGIAALQPREEYLAEAPCCCAHCARV